MKRLVLFAVVLVGTASAQLSAPDLDKGLIPYAAYHGGDLDSVNVFNGNLNLHIPLFSLPQRGNLELSFSIVYNNKSWVYTQGTTGPYYQWQGNGVTVNRNGALGQKNRTYKICDVISGCVYMHNTEFKSSDGATHLTSKSFTNPNFFASDATGMQVRDGIGLMDASGRLWEGTDPGPMGSTVTDPNGNKITAGTSGLIDSVGRSIPGSAGSAAYGSTSADAMPGVATTDFAGCPSGTASARLWAVPAFGGTANYKMCYGSYNLTSAFNQPYVQEGSKPDMRMINAVLLPDGTKWLFTYNSWGDLTSVTLPTGGSIEYVWQTNSTLQRVVSTRTVKDKDGSVLGQWSYSYKQILPSDNRSASIVLDPDANETVYFAGCDNNRASEVRHYNGDHTNGELLKKVETSLRCDLNEAYNYDPSGISAIMNVVPLEEKTTLNDGTQSRVTFLYDETTYSVLTNPFDSSSAASFPLLYGTVTQKQEYGYDGRLARTTITDYVHSSSQAYLNAGFVNLVSASRILDGNGYLCAETDYSYDDPAYLSSSGIGTQHVSSPNGLRGNVWRTTRRLTETPCMPNASWRDVPSWTYTYDTGMVSSTRDPLNHPRTYLYSSVYAGALLTEVDEVDSSHATKATYDARSGLITSITDWNQNSSTFAWDSMGRLTTANYPDGGQTVFTFLDVWTVRRQQKLDATRTANVYVYFDGLGRTKQTQLVDPLGDDFVETSYDSLGRIWKKSNQHRSTSSPTDGNTVTQYDALGRVRSVTKQDGSTTTTEYEGPCTTVTDESGRQRKSCVDAFGHLIRVDEPGGTYVSATAGQATLDITGTEQSVNAFNPGAYATGTVQISGTEGSATDPDSGKLFYDKGTVTINVNGFVKSVAYGQSSTSVSIANALASAINGASDSPVRATSSSGIVSLTSKTIGTAGNLPLSATSITTSPYFSEPSFYANASGPSLSGGVDPANGTVYDVGTVTLSVSGSSKTVPYGQASTTSSIAADLAIAWNSDSASPVSVQNSGATLTITSKVGGAFSNYSWALTSVTNQGAYFSQASFASLPASGAMSGGTDPGSGLNATWTTLYTYNTLGDLTCVEQHGNALLSTGCGSDPSNDGTSSWRIRRFSYDSLSRLRTAKNPELGVTNDLGGFNTGVVSYTYNDDDTVASKTSPKPNQSNTNVTATVTYSYDGLHRLTGKTYSNGDPSVQYRYDEGSANGLAISNGNGRRTSMSDASGQTAWSYDVMGRAKKGKRTIGTATTLLSYDYNYDGTPKTVTYPSNSVVTMEYDTVGRLLSAKDLPHGLNYAQNATYAPVGTLSTLTMGYSGSFAGYNLADSYNSRLQPTVLSATKPGQTIFSRSYAYGAPPRNNGNVIAISNNLDSNRSVTYQYDSLNRLIHAETANNDCSAVPTNPSLSLNWGTDFRIDPWGNLYEIVVTKCFAVPLSATLLNNNQLSGYGYDAAGNMILNNGVTYTYDGENRISTTGGATYTYDGDGVRVGKWGGTVTPTLYWGASFTGGPMAESDLSGTVGAEYVYFNGKRIARLDVATGKVHYYFSDHLNSANVVADDSGNVEEDSDFYPFGGERSYLNNLPDQHYRFTGKERDTETGLDYFGARYYGSNMGRWMSPDDVRNDSNVADPQSWNLYSYVRNNPLRYTDPEGKEATVTTQCSNDGKTCQVNVSASIAIYSVNGTTDAQMQQAQAAITKQVQDAWNGSFSQDGVTYNVTTTVNVSIVGSEQAAFNSGAQNAVGIDASGNAQNHLDAGPRGSGQDRGVWDFLSITSGQLSPHEFSHVVGLDDNHGNNLSNSFSPASMGNHPHATSQDLQWAFGPELHQHQSKFNVGQREGRDWLNRNRGNRHWWEVVVKQKDSD